MAILVTRAVTKHGRYYAAGTILEAPTSYERSLARLWGWETVAEPAPTRKGLRKPELVEAARERGLDTAGLTKNELIELLEE